MRLDKIVYRHIRLDNNKVFYVGIGNEKRPYSKHGRNKHWNNIVNKTDYFVEIIAKNISLEDACNFTNIKYSAEHLRMTRYKKNYRFIYV